MVMSDGYEALPGSDAFDPIARLRAIIKARSITEAELADRAGVSLALVQQVLREGTDGFDRNGQILQAIALGLGIDRNYLETGVATKDSSSAPGRRTRFYALLEEFVTLAKLEHKHGTRFISWSMRRFEQLLQSSVPAMYSEGTPQSNTELEEWYEEWRLQTKERRVQA
jgi:transcriptional regulator with XRE-family HTH domain